MRHIHFDIAIPDAAIPFLKAGGAETEDEQNNIIKQMLADYLEDIHWGQQALEAAKSGYLSQEDGEKWLQEMQSAGD